VAAPVKVPDKWYLYSVLLLGLLLHTKTSEFFSFDKKQSWVFGNDTLHHPCTVPSIVKRGIILIQQHKENQMKTDIGDFY
jgi:hypothetical protein